MNAFKKALVAVVASLALTCTLTPLPYAYAADEPTNYTASRTSYIFAYDVNTDKTAMYSINTNISINYANTTLRGTFPANAYIADRLVPGLSFTEFTAPATTSGNPEVEIELNDSGTVWNTIVLDPTKATRTMLPPNTTSFKATFKEDTQFASPSTFNEVIALDNVDDPLPQAPQSAMEVKLSDALVGTHNATFPAPSDKKLFSRVSFNPTPSILPTATNPDSVQFAFANRLDPPAANAILAETKYQFHLDEDIYLKKITIPAEAISLGKNGVLGDAVSYDLYIDGAPYQQALSSANSYSFDFDGDRFRYPEIVCESGSMLNSFSTTQKEITLEGAFKPGSIKNNYTNYVEVLTKRNGIDVSSLDPSWGANAQPMQRPLIRTSLNNAAEKSESAVGDDIVFSISEINTVKFQGDFSYMYLSFWNDINLREHYYLKEVTLELNTSGTILPIPVPIKLLSQDPDKGPITAGSIKLGESKSFTNDDPAYTAFDARGIILFPEPQRMTSPMLAVTPYELADITGGAQIKDMRISLVYGQIPGKPVSQTAVFENKMHLTVSPTNDLNHYLSESIDVIGTTKIVVPAGSDDPVGPTDPTGPDTPNNETSDYRQLGSAENSRLLRSTGDATPTVLFALLALAALGCTAACQRIRRKNRS